DHVGDVGGSSLDPGVREGAGEELAGGPDEWPPGEILVVPGLLADQHHRRALSPLAEDGLRGALPEVARAALGREASDLVERLALEERPLARRRRRRLASHPDALGRARSARANRTRDSSRVVMFLG